VAGGADRGASGGSQRPFPLCVRDGLEPGRFYDRFDAVVLLGTPANVLLSRIEARTSNPYGKTNAQRELVLRHLAEVEPLLRRRCTHQIDATQPLEDVVTELAELGRER
jgi:thymidylate kinase